MNLVLAPTRAFRDQSKERKLLPLSEFHFTNELAIYHSQTRKQVCHCTNFSFLSLLLWLNHYFSSSLDTDFDDQNPRFLDEKYTLLMDEAQQNLVGQNLQVLPRNLYAEDGDKGINAPIVYSFDQIGAFQANRAAHEDLPVSPSTGNSLADEASFNIENYLHLNPTSGEIRLIRQWPNRWSGSPSTLVVRATQADNKDRYTLTTLTITRPATSTSSRASDSATSKSFVASEAESWPTSGQSDSGKPTSGHFGVRFVPDKLTVDVPESVAINEKIAKVRARYLATNAQPGSTVTSVEMNSETSFSGEAAVDLISESPKQHNKAIRKPREPQQQQQQQPSKRPINYQILDDQADQFGINGLGEIFVKKSLDYEQKQWYKFRVLATYTKFSDICYVQVNVLNVNDNKPKVSPSFG